MAASEALVEQHPALGAVASEELSSFLVLLGTALLWWHTGH